MVSPFQGRPPTQQLLPPANRDPFGYWGGGGFQPGSLPQAPVEKTGIQGLLQKFLPSKLVQSSGGGTGLTGTLNNIQQVLKMTQSVTPLIQQYGPMVKNIPAMLTLLKAFQETDDEETVTDVDLDVSESKKELSGEDGLVEKGSKVTVKDSEDDLYQIETDMIPKKSKSNQSQTSKPRLYI